MKLLKITMNMLAGEKFFPLTNMIMDLYGDEVNQPPPPVKFRSCKSSGNRNLIYATTF